MNIIGDKKIKLNINEKIINCTDDMLIQVGYKRNKEWNIYKSQLCRYISMNITTESKKINWNVNDDKYN